VKFVEKEKVPVCAVAVDQAIPTTTKRKKAQLDGLQKFQTNMSYSNTKY
jgi:hypothetical protein